MCDIAHFILFIIVIILSTGTECTERVESQFAFAFRFFSGLVFCSKLCRCRTQPGADSPQSNRQPFDAFRIWYLNLCPYATSHSFLCRRSILFQYHVPTCHQYQRECKKKKKIRNTEFFSNWIFHRPSTKRKKSKWSTQKKYSFWKYICVCEHIM